jgi:hypothetical protein
MIFQKSVRVMETIPANLAERYWSYAAQCLVIAQRQVNACDKQALTDIAHAWIALAEKAQREALNQELTESVC